MPLPPTPWLNPPDYTGAYLRGAQIGASATEARNRLQAGMSEAAARTAISAQMSQQRLAQEAELASQRLAEQRAEAQLRAKTQLQVAEQRSREQAQRIAIDAAYKESMIGLQEQRLKEAKEKRAYQIEQSASQSLALQEISQRVKGGEAELDVWRDIGYRTGAKPDTLLRAAIQSRQADIPEELQTVPVIDPQGNEIPGLAGVPRGGQVTARNIPGYRAPGSVPRANEFYADIYKKRLEPIEAELSRIGEDPSPTRKKRYDELVKERDRLRKRIRELVPEPGMEGGEAAAPDEGWQDVGGFRVRVRPK